MPAAGVVLRSASPADAPAIAKVMRSALAGFDRMPMRHAPEEDLAFVRDRVLPCRQVTVAEADGAIVGFIAVHGPWVDQLYLDPAWTGQGIGSRLLRQAAPAAARLYCFQSNRRACRFYERHGFRAEASTNGGGNREGLPDILYVRRR